MHRNIAEILIEPEKLQARIAELAEKITADYHGRTLSLIGVLKGSVLFLSDLLKGLKLDAHVDFMMVSSYSGQKSTGVVRTLLDLKESIEGRDVLVVEDIVDSGLTVDYLLKNLKTRRPRSVEICTLLDKPSCRAVKVPIRYKGFDIPDKFVVGYGLDYNELYRNLPYIGVLKPSAIKGK
ncbi:MAG TPA: hypoxanthine phosphoribosyltransferase [Elusimicrobiales bacterium]|nr:hypoxanthine phosphoribosyltransferase [Elusimicrobiales bacterium]